MKIRSPDHRWTFTRRHAFHVLGLDGTGALHPARLRGIVRVARGGVWITAYPLRDVGAR